MSFVRSSILNRPNPPAKDFWAITMYDTQTRSQLQTDQQFPTLGSQGKGLKKNADGSYFRAIQRYGKEEPQRRDRMVEHDTGGPGLDQVQLIAAQVFWRCRIG